MPGFLEDTLAVSITLNIGDLQFPYFLMERYINALEKSTLPNHQEHLLQIKNLKIDLDKLGARRITLEKQQRADKQRKQKIQSDQWHAQGLCPFDGGKLSLFSKKCKVCGIISNYK